MFLLLEIENNDLGWGIWVPFGRTLIPFLPPSSTTYFSPLPFRWSLAPLHLPVRESGQAHSNPSLSSNSCVGLRRTRIRDEQLNIPY